MSEKKMLNKVTRKTIIFFVFALLLLLSIIALLAIQSNQSPQNKYDENVNESPINYFEINNSKLLRINNKSLTLPEATNIILAFSNYEYSDFTCIGNTNCDIYMINDTNGNIFYISTPVNVMPKDLQVDTNSVKSMVATKSGEIELEYKKQKLFSVIRDSNDEVIDIKEEESNIVVHLSGCLEEKICISSGVLSEDEAINKAQVEAFTNLVKGITVE